MLVGAQAFNNVDTYLAPFIRRDGLDYKRVKQEVQKMIHSLNTVTRWGGQCVPESYSALSPSGWKSFSDLKVGDLIYVYLNDGTVSTDNVYKTFSKEVEKETMILFTRRSDKKSFEFTENHRVVCRINGSKNKDTILDASQVLTYSKMGKVIFLPFIIEKEIKWLSCDVSTSEFSGKVWCPTTQTGTFIARKNDEHEAFITGNCPFTNFSFDIKCPKKMKNDPVIMDGKIQDGMTYGMFQKEMDMFNKAFCEVMIEGDSEEQIFSFPIPTYNITEDYANSVFEGEVGDLILDYTRRFGAPYFQNFINTDLDPDDIRSMCCRLKMDLREVRKKLGGIFGSGDLTGSIGVCTLNLPVYAYLSNTKEEYFANVKHFANICKDALEKKRKIITENLDREMMKYSKEYLKNGFKAFFSTIGIIGGNEACLNLLGKDISSEEGTKLMIDTINLLKDCARDFQEETGNLYNVEAVPGESTCYRLAKKNRKDFPNIITQGTEESPYYTNSTLLPVGATENVLFALEHQDKLQPLYNGGTVFHTFIGEALPDKESVKAFLLKAMSKTKIPFISLTPTFSICKKHGYINGEHFTCPTCGKDTSVYSRVVGYYRPVNRWNDGKKEEYKDRKLYEI